MNDIAKELNLQFSEEHNHFVLPNFRKLYAKFNFESGGLIYGLVKTPEFNKFHPKKKFIPEISSKLKIQFSTSHCWLLWKFLYKNIEIEDHLWLDIQNSQLKIAIKLFLQDILNLPSGLTTDL
ncbi:hypothetical protein EA772_01170 [Pedobacter sp. G11]|uniref:hypothetical protein n=1 Tax=Pedobacter sp. G11 TaxID=2482728 RepID=UPI000F5ED233|nr:hypothetical protein [Pedobacter sp. G11]AZI24019.1 hypothetical protein EA772_01170 [Pedobacter sp. G11]